MVLSTLPSPSTANTFTVLDDTFPENTALPAFMVSTTRGFLPRAVCLYLIPLSLGY